ncbi:MAG: hypothetical protein HOP19_16075 [Acidobacteria bacterium]|nr:hypothetical protein [Acidobacteriota bacterium]
MNQADGIVLFDGRITVMRSRIIVLKRADDTNNDVRLQLIRGSNWLAAKISFGKLLSGPLQVDTAKRFRGGPEKPTEDFFAIVNFK